MAKNQGAAPGADQNQPPPADADQSAAPGADVNLPPHERAGEKVLVVMAEALGGVDFSYGPGEKVKVPEPIATAWIKAGIATAGKE